VKVEERREEKRRRGEEEKRRRGEEEKRREQSERWLIDRLSCQRKACTVQCKQGSSDPKGETGMKRGRPLLR
jgi:hypothetical protein